MENTISLIFPPQPTYSERNQIIEVNMSTGVFVLLHLVHVVYNLVHINTSDLVIKMIWLLPVIRYLWSCKQCQCHNHLMRRGTHILFQQNYNFRQHNFWICKVMFFTVLRTHPGFVLSTILYMYATSLPSCQAQQSVARCARTGHVFSSLTSVKAGHHFQKRFQWDQN